MRIVLSIFVTWLAAMTTMLSIFLALPAGAFTAAEEASMHDLYLAGHDLRDFWERFELALKAGEPFNGPAHVGAVEGAINIVDAVAALAGDTDISQGSFEDCPARATCVSEAFSEINVARNRLQDCIDELANETHANYVEARDRCINAKGHLDAFDQTLTYVDYKVPRHPLQFGPHGDWPESMHFIFLGYLSGLLAIKDGFEHIVTRSQFGTRMKFSIRSWNDAMFAHWNEGESFGAFGPSLADQHYYVDCRNPAGPSFDPVRTAAFFSSIMLQGEGDDPDCGGQFGASHQLFYAGTNLLSCAHSSGNPCAAAPGEVVTASWHLYNATRYTGNWGEPFLGTQHANPEPTRRCAAGDGFVNFIDRQAGLARYNANAGCCDPEFATCDPTDPPCLDACADVQ